jgi:hypothetical protein
MADTNASSRDPRSDGDSFWPGFGRVVDYLFGRNALIGLASLMLLAISGYATWSGMNDFIVGVSSSAANRGREIVGGLSVTNEILVVAIVVALTFLMWLALRETFATGRRLRDRFLTLPLYLFLALWSIGFGYGFWWSLIAGEEATKKSLAGLQEDARDAGAIVAARLEAVKIGLDSVVQWSDGQMAREESSGGSCGVPSGAGRGPLYNARLSVRNSVSSLRDSIEKSWIAPVKEDLAKLRAAASGLEGETIAQRQQSFEAKAQAIRGSARSIAARSNQIGQSTAAEMLALANAVSVAPGQAGFSCHDPTLAERLRQAAKQAAAPAVLNLRPAIFTEGPAGVANAVKSLWSNIGAYATGLIRLVTGAAPPDGAAERAITGRDLIALLATLGIDLGLFVLTTLNPPRTPPRRNIPGPLKRQIIDAIRTAIKRAPNANWEWIRQHFLHHKGVSYFVIPNVYSCDVGRPGEQERGLAMNQLAGILEDLRLVHVLGTRELRALGRDEQRGSETDLTPYREKWHRSQTNGEGQPSPAKRMRNHGLFSKAERALEIARWSEAARSDVEIFRLVDREGLTPLLDVLNDPGEELPSRPLPGARAETGEDVKLLPAPETQKLYLEALCRGIGADQSAVPVLEKIMRANDEIEEALGRLFEAWPVVSHHFNRQRSALGREIMKTGEAIGREWILDEKTVYSVSDLPLTDLQTSASNYMSLDTIAKDMQRIGLGEGAAASDDARAQAIAAEVATIQAFLDPNGSRDTADVIDALDRLAALNGASAGE